MEDDQYRPEGSSIEEPIPPPFGDSLRIDSEDEENLDKLPEIERELILSERHDILQRYKEARTLYEKYMRRNQPATETAQSRSPVKRARSGKQSRYSDESDSERFSSSSYSSSASDSSYSSSSEDDEDAVRGLAKASTEVDIVQSMDASLSIDEALKLQITRETLLTSFQDVPVELRDDALPGLLIRVPSGTGEYLVASILRAVEKNGKSVDSGKFDLEISLPSGDTAIVPVNSVSNSAITEFELEAWREQVGEDAARELSRKVHKKLSQIRHVKEFVWDDGTINRILSQKNRSSVKLTLEIAKLRTQLQAELGALNSTNLSEEQRDAIQSNINRINAEISSLETQYRSTQQSFAEAHAHQFGIVAINHRNRTEQRKQDVEEARKRLKSDKIASKNPGELNPFKRRECKPVVMWDVGKRSPKKEPKADPLLLERGRSIDTPINSQKQTLSDIVSVDKIMANVAEAVSQPGARLAAVRRNMASNYSDNVSPVWAKQLKGITPGEIMDFAEWKRRVAEENVDMEE